MHLYLTTLIKSKLLKCCKTSVLPRHFLRLLANMVISPIPWPDLMFFILKNRKYLTNLGLLPVLFSPMVFATNGINLIGFGTESTLMGGADIAVARDTSAFNTNPAGLTQIHGQAFDSFASTLRTFDLSHQDSFGNDKHADNKYTFLGGGGYAISLESLPCTAGSGLFSQGGAGGVFKKYS